MKAANAWDPAYFVVIQDFYFQTRRHGVVPVYDNLSEEQKAEREQQRQVGVELRQQRMQQTKQEY